jgi:hypothetical protein
MEPQARLPLHHTGAATEEVGLATECDEQYDGFMEEEPNVFDSNAPG